MVHHFFVPSTSAGIKQVRKDTSRSSRNTAAYSERHLEKQGDHESSGPFGCNSLHPVKLPKYLCSYQYHEYGIKDAFADAINRFWVLTRACSQANFVDQNKIQ